MSKSNSLLNINQFNRIVNFIKKYVKKTNNNKINIYTIINIILLCFIFYYIFHHIYKKIKFIKSITNTFNIENFTNTDNAQYIYFINSDSAKKLFISNDYLNLINNYRLTEIVVKTNNNIFNNIENIPSNIENIQKIFDLKYNKNIKNTENNQLHKYPEFNINNSINQKININSFMRKELDKFYQKNTIEFSLEEQKNVSEICLHCNSLFKKYFKKDKLPYWNFLKLKSSIDWDYPYTVGRTIVFTQYRLYKLLELYNTQNTDNMNITLNTFVHEYLHILQRLNQNVFNMFYKKYWKFHIIPDIIKDNINNNLWLQTYHISNPDGLNNEWCIKENNKYYIPFLMLNPDSIKEHKPILLVANEYGLIYENEDSKMPKYEILDNNPLFNKYTFGISQSYHPNEIYANLVSTYIVNQNDINANNREMGKFASYLLEKLDEY